MKKEIVMDGNTKQQRRREINKKLKRGDDKRKLSTERNIKEATLNATE
jgi:hypothetical protein